MHHLVPGAGKAPYENKFSNIPDKNDPFYGITQNTNYLITHILEYLKQIII